MTAVAVELLTRPPEPADWRRPARCPHSRRMPSSSSPTPIGC